MMTAPGAPSSAENRYATGLNLGTGVSARRHRRASTTQGTFATTGNALDLAIDGAGYFQVEMPDGRTGYTRAGNFGRSPEGTIVTSDGKPLHARDPDSRGQHQCVDRRRRHRVGNRRRTRPDATELGQIELARFANPAGLQAIGDNMLVETAASGAPQVGAAGLEGRGSGCAAACSRDRTSMSSRNSST